VTELDPVVGDLAAALGVATEYLDWQGRLTQVPASTVVEVLSALGAPARSADQAAASLKEHRLAPWRRMLPATVVARRGDRSTVTVHVPHGDQVQLWVELEDGCRRDDVEQVDRWVEPQLVDSHLVGEATFALPTDLPLGWHRLRARSAPAAHPWPMEAAAATLVVTPRALDLDAVTGPGRAWGFMTQLYQVRSRRSWGIGDLADLADLATWSGRELGAGFILVNPLHAASPASPIEPSPYLPTTRRFPSPLYLRVEDVAEMAGLAEPQRLKVEQLRAGLSSMVDDVDTIDRDAAWAAKRAALELLAEVELTPPRAQALAAFVGRVGPALADFATWCALVDVYGPRWRDWPATLHSPDAPRVRLEAKRLAAGVDLHTRMQWWLDEQLGAAQRAARDSGMPIGIVHDLAVGVDPEGFDSWALRPVLAEGLSVGAPPDEYNQQGQRWSQPPWRPAALAEAGYGPYRDMLRVVLRHAGGVRVDHILGLFRLWLVPDGARPDQGTYLRQDHEELVGILALEAARAGALVVGEDLGTVEPWVRDFLSERGIAGTSVLWFERDWAGDPLPAQRWRQLCLASVTTHDLPPTAGYLRGEHVRIRSELGLLTRPVDQERALDEVERRRWLDYLGGQGLLEPGGGDAVAGPSAAPDDVDGVVRALHRFLVATPARLIGVALPDAVGDRRAQNQPGTSDEYPNWRVPLTDPAGRPVWLEDLADGQRVRALAEVMAAGAVGAWPAPPVG